MARNRKVAGTIQFRVNDTVFEAKGNFIASLTRVERESVVGQDGVHGFTEIPKVLYIAGDLTDFNDLNLNEINELDDVTVEISLANGKKGILEGAWQTDPNELNTVDGSFPVRFEGPKGHWIQA